MFNPGLTLTGFRTTRPSSVFSYSLQSRSQSPRNPCPAERENEDLWNTVFQVDISLANNRACAIVPEVDKQ